ncbi:MAG: Ig-like domain-containing protein [Pseudomonadota bacterium]|nr:Ig-like domain-containing protein [Pseudomonadota bacterium]
MSRGKSKTKITGTNDANLIYGGNGNDRINAKGGNDVVWAGNGNDLVDGGDGHDELGGDHGNDTIYGGSGNDTAWGGEGNDRIDAGCGDDLVSGDAGDDTIDGGDGNDLLFGDTGNDRIDGGDGDDWVDGGTGNDSLDGGRGDDGIDGGEGNDTIDGGYGNDWIDGGAGDDKIEGGKGDDCILAGEGDDTVDGGDGDDHINGGAGNDLLKGGDGNDTILGDGDVDTGLTGITALTQNADGTYDISGQENVTITVDVLGSNAGYNNSFGVYFADANGRPISGQILFANVKDCNGAVTLELDASQLCGAVKLGFFLIPDGERKNGSWLKDGATVDFSQERDGDWIASIGKKSINTATGKDGILFSDAGLNKDGKDHEKDNNAPGNSNWEDLLGLGDKDFDDVNLQIDVTAGRALYDDTLFGGEGDDLMNGGAGNDIMYGDTGSDDRHGRDDHHYNGFGWGHLFGHYGKGHDKHDHHYKGKGYGHHEHHGHDDGNSDTMDGGAGNDTLFGEGGDDLLQLVLSENAGASDAYDGGRGFDVLELIVTRAEAAAAAFQADVVAFLDFLDRFSNENSDNGPTFTFQSFGLTATDFEDLLITVVDGEVNQPPVVAPIDGGTVSEDDAPLTLDLLEGSFDPEGGDLSAFNLTVSASDGRTVDFVFDENTGLATVDPAQFNDLGAGESLTITITYEITDADGGVTVNTASFVVTGVNDAPVVSPIDAGTVSEDDAPLTIDLLQGAFDPEGTDLSARNVTVTASDNRAVDFAVDENTGLATVDPTQFDDLGAGESLTITITYEVTDADGGVTVNTASFVVTGVNDAPVVSPIDAGTVSEDDSPLTIDLLQGAFDPEGTDLSARNVTVTASDNRTVDFAVDENTGLATVDPTQFDDLAAGESVTITITYEVTDADGGVTVNTASFVVTGANDGPVAGAGLASVTDEDVAVSIDVLSSASDADGDTLTVVSATALHGTVVIEADGSLTYTPDADYNGPDTVSYTLSDGTVTADGTVEMTVNPVNDDPVAAAFILEVDEDTPANIDVLAGASDIDGDTLTVVSASAANGTVVIEADGTITYTPDADFNGPDTITYTISDGNGGTDTAEVAISVSAVNDGPVVGAGLASVTDEDVAVSIDVLSSATDADGDTLTVVSATALHGTVVIEADGSLTYTPDADYNGPDTVSYTLSDGTVTADGTVEMTVNPVNDDPVAAAFILQVDEDTPANIDVLAGASDIDGDTLTVVSASAANGTVVIEADGTITYTPDADFNGPDTITYTISDGNGGTDAAEVAISVSAVNDGPVVGAGLASVTDEDVAVSIDVLSSASDVDGDTLTVVSATALHGTVVIEADGSLTYTPDADYNGPDTVSYTLSDGTLTADGTVEMTVNPVNDDPVAAAFILQVEEDTPANIDVLAQATDIDGDTLTVISASAANGTVVIEADGTITYTPNADYNGPDTITYTISDGNGGTDTTEVDVTVEPVADAPIAGAGLTSTTDEDVAVNIDVLSSASDPDGDTLSVTAASALNGTVVIEADGSLTYTPNADFNGPDQVSYTLSDGTLSTASTVSVVVNPVNDAPTAVADVLAAPNLTGFIYNPENGHYYKRSAVATNFDGALAGAKADGGYLVTITSASENAFVFTTVGGGATHWIAGSDRAVEGVWVYNSGSPEDGFQFWQGDAPNGFAVNGAFANWETGQPNSQGGNEDVILLFSGGKWHDAPTSFSTRYITEYSPGFARIATGNLLANDTDVENHALTLTAVAATSALGASLTLAGGEIIYNAIDAAAFAPAIAALDVGETIIDTFEYTVTDALGATSTGTVSIEVVGTNDAPVVVDESIRVSQGQPFNIDVLANDSDPEGDTLSVITASAFNGTVVIEADGTITYTGNGGVDQETITYTVSDGERNTIGSVNVIIGLDVEGTAGSDLLFGGVGDDTITGNGGNDLITGGAGADRFVFDDVAGTATVTDFDAGAAVGDVLDVSAFGFADFNDIMGSATDDGSDTTITLDGDNTLVLLGVVTNDLHQNDFAFN